MVKIANIELGDFLLLLAPMEDVSDPPFRYVYKKYGADLMYTEFISSEGLIRDAIKSKKKLVVCSSYIAGVNLKYYHNYKINGVETDTPIRNTEIVPTIGITIRHYTFKDIGVYIKGGISYRVNMLNVDFCYKLKK